VETTWLECPKIERQGSVNNFGPCILENPRTLQQVEVIIRLSAAFLCKNRLDDIATMS
jgi:hypothetical protein